MKFKLAAIGSAMLLALAVNAGPASATMWDFYTLGGSPGVPGASLGSNIHTFTQGSESVFVESAMSTGCPPITNWCVNDANLYIKNAGSVSEQGLGLTDDAYKNQNEISHPNGIYLNLAGAGGHASNVELGSVQAGETWSIWGTNVPGGYTTWTELGSGTGTGAIVNFNSSVLAGYSELIVADPFLMNQGTGHSNDIILMSITTVPEPGALALFAAGLLGCALFVSRRRRMRQD